MNNATFRPALLITVGILGVLLAVSFNTTLRLDEARPERAANLVGVVQEMELQRVDLQNDLADLRAAMSGLEQEAAEAAGLSESFSTELASAREMAGLSGIRGPGIEVVLGDGFEVAAGDDPNDYLIHDTDIAGVVNAMLSGGAEAVEVNGERIVATTPIRCAGTTVLVNATRIGSPYTIRAVGDGDRIEAAIMRDPVASLLFTVYANQFGLQVELAQVSETEVAPYRGSLRPQYAGPTDAEDPS